MKVAIIGAGICGLYLAWKLAERGEEVTVFEKREKIGKEACSGLFSERILEFIPESQKLIQNKIDFALIHLSSFRGSESADEDESKLRRRKFHRLSSRTLKIRFAKKFFVIDHFKLDNLVAELAQKAGAKIILNKDVTKQDLVTSQAKRTSSVESKTRRKKKHFSSHSSSPSLGESSVFDKVVGCDGANSIVRKWVNLPEPKFRLGIQGFVSKVEEDKSSSSPFDNARVNDSSNYVETWPVKNGFLWKIPRGNKLEYGIIGNSEEANFLFDQFLKKNNLSLKGVKSALVPQGFNIPKNKAITLCGDAAGLTKLWSGGGVIWGLLAADLLLKNFPDFLKYQKEAKKFFLSKIIFSKIITKMVYFFGFNIPWLIPQNVKIESDFLI